MVSARGSIGAECLQYPESVKEHAAHIQTVFRVRPFGSPFPGVVRQAKFNAFGVEARLRRLPYRVVKKIEADGFEERTEAHLHLL